MTLSDNEVLKAIEHCLSSDTIASCVGCPIDVKDCLECNEDVAELSNYLVKIIVDLINQQKAELEKLKKNNEKIHIIIPKMIEAAKAEAIKEFAERLKENFIGFPRPNNMVAIRDSIDNLVKEMVGDID